MKAPAHAPPPKHRYTVADVVFTSVLSVVLAVVVGWTSGSAILAGLFFVGMLLIFNMLVMLYFAEAMLYSVTRFFGPNAMPDPFVIGAWTAIINYLEEKYGS